MVLIFTHKTSPRLQYIADFIFKEIYQVPFSITEDEQFYLESDAAKINYCGEELSIKELRIGCCGFLEQTTIEKQSIDIFEDHGFTAFFKSSITESEGFSFDLFSAIFYLISRYEEYLPHKKDKYGRYAYGNSLAFQENFLHLPLIDIWLKYLAYLLRLKFPGINIKKRAFKFLPTYDVDIAYCWLHKGFFNNIASNLRSLSTLNMAECKHNLKVIFSSHADPYDNFEWLNNLHKELSLQPLYFFLVAEKRGLYDKNLLPGSRVMTQLITDHAKRYGIGLHPSWLSGDNIAILEKEKATLEKISGQAIEKSRQHYLRFNLPEGYRRLSQAGVTEDYSMGYGSVNGFRASVASPFFWYDLEAEKQTSLKVYPFCYMDSASIFNLQLTPEEAESELTDLYNICEEVDGTFISIFHNHLLGSDREDWRNLYAKFLQSAKALINA